MEKEIIKDTRLTPTMERVRSGRTQLFREKNPEDRSFISSDNADVILEHERKEMYAELIDGVWYWVNGCSQCNGYERSKYSYIECEKHDVCRVCSAPRKDFDGPVMGGLSGWTCKPCYQKEKEERKRLAIEKFNKEEHHDYEFMSNDEIICPNCGSTIYDEEFYQSGDIICDVCDIEFEVEVEYSRSFTTRLK